MPNITHSLDWLQYSVTWPNEVRTWPLHDDEQLAILRTCVPQVDVTGLPPERAAGDRIANMQGYPETFDMLYASAHVDPRRREQKIGVRFTGSGLNAYRDLGGTMDRLVEFVLGVHGETSRVDIAFDLFDYSIDPLRIYADWCSGKVRTTARTIQPLTKATRGEDGVLETASTLYIGSRQSETMVRIYEKGKQMAVDLDWCRIEIELKGNKAKAAMLDMARVGVAAVGQAILAAAMPEVPYKFWRDLVRGKTVELTPVGRKPTEREVWLRDIILPLLQEEIRAEWEGERETGITTAVESLVRSNWTRRARYIRETYSAWQMTRANRDDSQVS